MLYPAWPGVAASVEGPENCRCPEIIPLSCSLHGQKRSRHRPRTSVNLLRLSFYGRACMARKVACSEPRKVLIFWDYPVKLQPACHLTEKGAWTLWLKAQKYLGQDHPNHMVERRHARSRWRRKVSSIWLFTKSRVLLTKLLRRLNTETGQNVKKRKLRVST